MVLALVLPATGTLMAQEQQRQEEQVSDTTTLDRVTVTGSRIKRAEVEGPSPVTVITREDMDREGFQTVADMLDTLTQGTSINYAGDLSAGGGFTPNSQVVNLRGIGPGYTLVLINGRRMADYPQPYNADRSSVNVGSIPSSIIERVEVLAGGASAIYGSDAIAGVVNIILRENMDYNQVRLTAGTTTNGGGDSVDFEFSGGKVGDRWSATYAFQYHANEPIFASQRDFMDDRRDGPNPNAGPGLALAVIDLQTSLLPDDLTLPLLWGGLFVNLWGGFAFLPDAVIGAMAGYGVLWSVYWLFRLLTGKEGMGYGDFKLLAAIGAWLGWQSLPLVMVAASLAGVAVAGGLLLAGRVRRDQPLPFGPYLAVAGVAALFAGDAWIKLLAW